MQFLRAVSAAVCLLASHAACSEVPEYLSAQLDSWALSTPYQETFVPPAAGGLEEVNAPGTLDTRSKFMCKLGQVSFAGACGDQRNYGECKPMCSHKCTKSPEACAVIPGDGSFDFVGTLERFFKYNAAIGNADGWRDAQSQCVRKSVIDECGGLSPPEVEVVLDAKGDKTFNVIPPKEEPPPQEKYYNAGSEFFAPTCRYMRKGCYKRAVDPAVTQSHGCPPRQSRSGIQTCDATFCLFKDQSGTQRTFQVVDFQPGPTQDSSSYGPLPCELKPNGECRKFTLSIQVLCGVRTRAVACEQLPADCGFSWGPGRAGKNAKQSCTKQTRCAPPEQIWIQKVQADDASEPECLAERCMFLDVMNKYLSAYVLTQAHEECALYCEAY